jgi:RimJ/RimL family protein N-acetyltransferase
MILDEHVCIRTTDPDDAAVLHSLYGTATLRAALLDLRREPVIPTLSELREILDRKEAQQGAFYTVEDREGVIRGFCSVRMAPHETRLAELTIMFPREEDYAGPLADAVFYFLCDRAFRRANLHKAICQCLNSETALQAFLESHGFHCDGIQRQVLYSGGRWYDLASYTLFARQVPQDVAIDLASRTGVKE